MCLGSAKSFLAWEIVDDASNSTVFKGDCRVKSLGNMPPGTYRLIIPPYLNSTGAYAGSIQPAQLFNATVPLSVTAGMVNGTAVALSHSGRRHAAGDSRDSGGWKTFTPRFFP